MYKRQTGDIETTKKLMGHKSLKSTAVYADVLTEEKVKAIGNTKTCLLYTSGGTLRVEGQGTVGQGSERLAVTCGEPHLLR